MANSATTKRLSYSLAAALAVVVSAGLALGAEVGAGEKAVDPVVEATERYEGRGCCRGRRHRMGPGNQATGGRGGRGRDVMQATHALVHEYRESIVRDVEEVENGVVTVTRSPDNPEAAAMLQRHVLEMQGVLEDGGRVRAWDPLFSEIFDRYEAVEMVVEKIDDGVRMTETSDDPEVVKLIQAHAYKVNEFLARGPAAVHEPTPLPDGYRGSGARP